MNPRINFIEMQDIWQITKSSNHSIVYTDAIGPLSMLRSLISRHELSNRSGDRNTLFITAKSDNSDYITRIRNIAQSRIEVMEYSTLLRLFAARNNTHQGTYLQEHCEEAVYQVIRDKYWRQKLDARKWSLKYILEEMNWISAHKLHDLASYLGFKRFGAGDILFDGQSHLLMFKVYEALRQMVPNLEFARFERIIIDETTHLDRDKLLWIAQSLSSDSSLICMVNITHGLRFDHPIGSSELMNGSIYTVVPPKSAIEHNTSVLGLHLVDGSSKVILPHGIRRLCHFTHSTNLPHILRRQNGLLSLDRLHQEQDIVFRRNDFMRLDRRGNHVSCTVEYPNTWYLNKLQMTDKTIDHASDDWVVLFIHPAYIWKIHTMYCATNASFENGAMIEASDLAFLRLYSPVIQTASGKRLRNSTHLPCCPTDLQAEILIDDHVHAADILGIAVRDMAQAQREVDRLHIAGISTAGITWTIAPDLFDARSLSKMVQQGVRPHEIIWHASGGDQER